MIINGNTELLFHIGYPTHTFTSPMIYNPYFNNAGINALVVPIGSKPENFPEHFKNLFTITNMRGLIVTMPHKVITSKMVDILSPTAEIAGACNAVRRNAEGLLEGELFDGEGFVKGVENKGFNFHKKSALVSGCGGVGSAIAASIAKAGVSRLAIYDLSNSSAESLKGRLLKHYPNLVIETGSKDPSNFDLVVNATPIGMNHYDPISLDINQISPSTFVCDVILRDELTPLLQKAQEKGCPIQVGVDMLFEQIPIYLSYFGLPSTTAENLRHLSQIKYR